LQVFFVHLPLTHPKRLGALASLLAFAVGVLFVAWKIKWLFLLGLAFFATVFLNGVMFDIYRHVRFHVMCFLFQALIFVSFV